jgi:DNA invertase Pin-like site-specific DNA recombinase
MAIYGYIRVSTREQNESRQLVAMREFGITEGNILLDKQSGKDFNRVAYRQLMTKLIPGDILVVKSIDRLGRDYSEILEQWRIINKEKCVDIKVLDMPLLDTTYCKDLLGTFISDLVLSVLSLNSQLEREFIRQRQAEGISSAKIRGVKFGRPAIERPPKFGETHEAWASGEISAREAGRRLGVSHMTFLTWVEE